MDCSTQKVPRFSLTFVSGVHLRIIEFLIMNHTDAMFHDERYFDRPDEFIPERFLKHPFGIKDGVEDDPARRPNMAFGGGKRVCPGIAFSKSSLVCLQSG